ncbi:hypothetical protein PaG_06534 [Moesziomyces aphidis]|uniref:G10 protein n=1 Tax=Moesziomyces aphidis TaxID=84754 RepID=W3VDK7_MOEAP|nr:hypothetical protein PaG_06534 [Moesziomyces aphidis]
MPRLRTSRSTPPPEGFEDIEQILDDYERKMRDAEADDSQNKRKVETLWPIIQINHTRSRYIYDLFYKREAISRELYDWLLKYQYADAKLSCVQAPSSNASIADAADAARPIDTPVNASS